jgi:hypothetical protein
MPSMNEPIGAQVNTNAAQQLSFESATREGAAMLPSGVRVEIRNRFDGAWSSGFQLLAAHPDGYLVRRLSDRSVLPVAFAETDIRLDAMPLPTAQGGWLPPPAA